MTERPEYWHETVQRGGAELSAFIANQLSDQRRQRAELMEAVNAATEAEAAEAVPAEPTSPDAA